MLRRPPRSTRTDTLFPYTTLFRSIDVARLGDRLDHGKPSVTLTLPAVENAVAPSILAWTVDSVVGAHHAVIEPGERDCHLEGGARGVQIGRATGRERVCQYVSISLVGVSLNKKHNQRVHMKKTSK